MPDLIPISEAASRLSVKPWEVRQLIDEGRVRHVLLVDADSVTEYQESSNG